MPANAGIQGWLGVGFKLAWIPAFAGMTDEKPSRYMSLNLCADVYYGRFYRSKCVQVLRHLNEALAAWARRKYKRLRRRERASMHWLGRIAQRDPQLFVLWQFGVRPQAGS
jgi:hypothetical protein